MDLLAILPTFSTKPYAHILPPLERNNINTIDLITLDTLEIAKRAHVPPADVRCLSAHILDILHRDVGFEREDIGGGGIEEEGGNTQCSSLNADVPVVPGPLTKVDLSRWSAISTLDPAMDALLDGGIPAGYVTEVTGESGSGKTQFLLSLLLAVQLPSPKGLAKRAIYISTEAPLATPRLSQYLEFHPYLSNLSGDHDQIPSLQNILSINAMDLETQDHIFNYQLPVAIARYDVGLVVVDSITANFRAEHTSHDVNALSTRSGELAKLGTMLRNLAVDEDVAVVVANQVSDRFDPMDNTYPIITSRIHAGNDLSQPTPDSPTPQIRTAPAPTPETATETTTVELSQPPPTQLHLPTTNPPESSPALPSSPFTTEEDHQSDGSYLVSNPIRNETLSLLHQQRFFTGWGDSDSPHAFYQRQAPKTPALGFVWTSQIACRIALVKEDVEENAGDSWERGYRNTSMGVGLETQTQSESTRSEQEEEEEEEEEEERETTPPPPSRPPSTDHPKPTPETNSTTTDPSKLKPPPQPPTPAGGGTVTAPEIHEKPLRRTMKLVFAPWSAGSSITTIPPDRDKGTDEDIGPSTDAVQDEIEFVIWRGGLRSVPSHGHGAPYSRE